MYIRLERTTDNMGQGSKSPQDELEEALRQLEARSKPQTPPRAESSEEKQRFEQRREEEHRKSRAEIDEALGKIREEQQVARAKGVRSPWVRRIGWALVGIIVVTGIITAIVMFRPEPLPPPAGSPTEAVEGFWKSLIESKYQAATIYYPIMVQRYGSRKQAALRLQELFKDNPPVHISAIGEPQEVPDTTDVRISYEVYLRNGRPRSGEFIVSKSSDLTSGWAITSSP